ncbi:MAG TPA: MBOAT family protein, partial [Labilithrix sp.]
MWTEPLRALIVQIALAVAAALVARRARPAALVLGAAAFFGAPWLAGPIPLFRALIALMGFVDLLRVVDLVRLRETWSARRRVTHVLSFVDTRTLRPAPRHLDVAALARALLWAALGAGGFYVARSPLLFVRWAGGLAFVYATIAAGYAFVGFLHRAVGFVTPPLHVSPYASSSIGELWGTRWARPVSAWLRETCFRPLARRGHPMLGLMLGFVVSAIGHAFPVLVALGASMAAWMLAFFL